MVLKNKIDRSFLAAKRKRDHHPLASSLILFLCGSSWIVVLKGPGHGPSAQLWGFVSKAWSPQRSEHWPRLSPVFLVVMARAAQLNPMLPVPESKEGPRNWSSFIPFQKRTLSDVYSQCGDMVIKVLRTHMSHTKSTQSAPKWFLLGSQRPAEWDPYWEEGRWFSTAVSVAWNGMTEINGVGWAGGGRHHRLPNLNLTKEKAATSC